MAKAKKTVYRLFALPMGERAMEAAQNERFSRICTGYALIYTTNAVPGGVEVSEAESRARLTKTEAEWLLDCNTVILAEEAKRNEKKTLESLSKRMAALEAALAEAKQKEDAENGIP